MAKNIFISFNYYAVWHSGRVTDWESRDRWIEPHLCCLVCSRHGMSNERLRLWGFLVGFTSYLLNGWSVNLRAIENCIFSIRSIERNFYFILRTVHRWTTSIRDYLREFSKKIETIPKACSEARGTLIYEKILKSKISCQTPFKEDCKRSHPPLPLTSKKQEWTGGRKLISWLIITCLLFCLAKTSSVLSSWGLTVDYWGKLELPSNLSYQSIQYLKECHLHRLRHPPDGGGEGRRRKRAGDGVHQVFQIVQEHSAQCTSSQSCHRGWAEQMIRNWDRWW
jgi:hypothetical protein